MSGTSSVYHPMLDNLTARLAKIVKQIRGEARLTEANIQDALREVRLAWREAADDFLAQGLRAHRVDEVLYHRQRGAPRARSPDGRGERRLESRDAAAGGDPDGGAAGLGQDHHLRQAREAARRGEEKSAAGVMRRLPSRRHRAAEDCR